MPGRALTKYRHYKGTVYEVHGIARHSETLEELVVYAEPGSERFWIRPKDMFFENVVIEGKEIPRFTKLED